VTVDETLTLEESRALLTLCKAGKLYQVEEWIRQGKSLKVHPKSRDEPLHATLRTGFFSLIELLARHTESQDLKNEVLLNAVRRQMPDVAMMLVEQGADPTSVPFSDVICAWDPAMMRFFLSRGCDPFKEDSFARGLSYGIRTALGFYMDCKRDHPEQADDLQRQLDMALSLFCREGNEKWVAMLMWAGGDPHAKVRDLECKDDPEKPWNLISGAEEAARKGHVKVLELLDLDASHPDAQRMLHEACSGIHEQAVHYLLKLGVDPNDKENGGSSGLDTVLIHMDWGKRWQRLLPGHSCTARTCLTMARDLIRHKARWRPDACNLCAVRRAACEVGPEYVSELVDLLGRPSASSPADLQKLVGSPQMQDQLKRGNAMRRR
jgi:hypothetical protein